MQTDLATTSPPSVLGGLIDQDELMRQLNCSERTIARYRAVGLPVIVLGKRVLFDPVAVREWIVSHQRRHDAPRRGRPSKRAA